MDKIPIYQYNGLYTRGMGDACPPGFFQDCLNITLSDNDEAQTRFGIDELVATATLRRVAIYKRLNETSRYLYLDTSGNFYDSLYGPALITNAAFTDFSMVNINNRAYVTFHNRVTGVGSGLYVYEGSGAIRLAAGTPPSAFTLLAVDSASAGDVEIGTHLFAIAFETTSGFVTAPGPEIFAVYEAPGALKVDISVIPVGPAGTTARWVLGTRVIPDYDGNQLGVEFFFIPDGRIGNNTSTTLTIDFFDANLYTSADYLFDNRSTIPAGTFVRSYGNRLIIGGISGDAHTLLVSREDEPEVFDSVSGYLTVDKSDATSGITNATCFRNSLFITKSNRTYITQESSGIDPIDWSVDSVDTAIGTQCHGIATILDATGSNTDRWFIADPSGLFVFESGLFRKPAMSYNIEDIWKRINKTVFNKVQLACDAENNILYIAVPLDNATEVSHLLVAFYDKTIGNYGFIVPSKVRWSIYGFPYRPTSVTVDVNTVGVAVLKFGSLDGNIYEMSTSDYDDDGTVIDSYIETALYTLFPGWVNQYTHLKLRIKGQGVINLVLKNEDSTLVQTMNSWLTLEASPGYELANKMNFVSEKMSIKIRTSTNSGDYFKLFSMLLTTRKKWATRAE